MDLIGTEMIVGKEEGEGTLVDLTGDSLCVEGKVLGLTRRRLVLERVGLKRKEQS
jgi:hypothetical protein